MPKPVKLFTSDMPHQHRWAPTLILLSAISDIAICYSDIGDKYVGLKNVIPISEVFQYPTLKKKIIPSGGFEPLRPMEWKASVLTLSYVACPLRLECWIFDIR
jgi:hypothetical protein